MAHKHFLSTNICMPVIILRAKNIRMTEDIHDLKEPISNMEDKCDHIFQGDIIYDTA